MNNVERYERLIMSALEAQQSIIDLKGHLKDVADNMTAYELSNRSFNDDDAKKAFAIINDSLVDIEECQFIKSRLKFKDVEISLHCLPNNVKADAIRQVMKDLTNNQIFNCVP